MMDNLSAEELYVFIKKKGEHVSDLAQVIRNKEINGNIFNNYNELQWRSLMNAKMLKELWPKINYIKETYNNETRRNVLNVRKQQIRPVIESRVVEETVYDKVAEEENVYGNVKITPDKVNKQQPPSIPSRTITNMTLPNKNFNHLPKLPHLKLDAKPILPPRNTDVTVRSKLPLPGKIIYQKNVSNHLPFGISKPPIVEDELNEYEDINAIESDVDDEGYLLPGESSEIHGSMQSIKDSTTLVNEQSDLEADIKKKLSCIFNRPLPSIPQPMMMNESKTLNFTKVRPELPKFLTLPTPPKKMVGPPIETVCNLANKNLDQDSLLYFRRTDRKGADLLLSGLDEGAFLIRPSKKYKYTMSIKTRCKILHVGIIDDNHTFQLQVSNGHEPKIFDNLKEMINFYLENPIHVVIVDEIQELYIRNLLPAHMH